MTASALEMETAKIWKIHQHAYQNNFFFLFSFYRQTQNIAEVIHNIFATELKKCVRQLMSACMFYGLLHI